MNRRNRIICLSVIAFSFIFYSSCRKINEATEIGRDLIPAVDNIHTFEASLEAITDNRRFDNDSIRVQFADQVALGEINDPAFGNTKASIFFSIRPNEFGKNPFLPKDSIEVDSVVLSLQYTGAYGDTNSTQTIRVYEIPQSSSFRDDSFYRYSTPEFEIGAQLASKTVTINQINDSFSLIRKKDTIRLVNVVRIPLPNDFANRFIDLSLTGGSYQNINTFNTIFKGFALKADASNVLTYYDINAGPTHLTIYYRHKKNTGTDTLSYSFLHGYTAQDTAGSFRNGLANIIHRTPGGGWGSYLSNPADVQDEELYIQTTPGGSYATIKVPALDTFRNAVIHRAELVMTKIPSPGDDIFKEPSALFLDKINTGDTALLLLKDIAFEAPGLVNYDVFGGELRTDNTYRFNVTRHVQGIVSSGDINSTFRVFAPMFTTAFPYMNFIAGAPPVFIPISTIGQPARGRVVLAGGNHPIPSSRLRLRIIYSRI